MMNKQEKVIVQNCAKRINQLASLERAGFDTDKEKDEYIKKKIKPYMMWFEIVADELQELIDLQEKKDSYYKKDKLEELVNRSYRL